MLQKNKNKKINLKNYDQKKKKKTMTRSNQINSNSLISSNIHFVFKYPWRFKNVVFQLAGSVRIQTYGTAGWRLF